MFFFRLLVKAARLWIVRHADQHAAALAYFTPFALTPLIIFSITLVGLIFGAERVVAMLLRWGNAVDPGVADLLHESVKNFDAVSSHYYLPVIGVALLSVMIFITLNSLVSGLHDLWGVERRGWGSFLSRLGRIFIFILILQAYLVGILLLGDILAVASAYTGWVIWPFVGFFATFLATMFLLALGYGLLSLSSPSFPGRFMGAAVAGLLLLFSRELVAFHFTTAPVQTLFGAAGLLISLLVWVYVGASLILYGAAFAAVYDEATGRTRPTT